MVEFKVVEGSRDVLLLINGRYGTPAQEVDPDERDGNELYRFEVSPARLAKALKRREPSPVLDNETMRSLLRRCIPFIEGDCDGVEYDEIASNLLDEVYGLIGEI